MSAQRISLKSKPLVAGVLVVLAIVAGVNAMVFKPGSRRLPQRQARVQSSQTLPMDIGDFRHGGALPAEDLAAWQTTSRPTLRRDPFGQEARNVAVAAVQLPDNPDAAVEDLPAPLVCNAVLLGGGPPAAVISGKSYRMGSQVDEYTVGAIGTAGVKLIGGSGPDLFLSVSTGNNSPRRSRVVNGLTRMEGLAETSLVEHARGERK